jgi:hypothetical protein
MSVGNGFAFDWWLVTKDLFCSNHTSGTPNCTAVASWEQSAAFVSFQRHPPSLPLP